MRLRLFDEVRDLAKDAYHPLAADQRHRAHLHREATARAVDENDRRVGRVGTPEQLAREHLPGPSCVLRGDDGGELPPVDVADQAPARRIQPADDSGRVDQVARDVDVLERMRDVDLEVGEGGNPHLRQCRPASRGTSIDRG